MLSRRPLERNFTWGIDGTDLVITANSESEANVVESRVRSVEWKWGEYEIVCAYLDVMLPPLDWVLSWITYLGSIGSTEERVAGGPVAAMFSFLPGITCFHMGTRGTSDSTTETDRVQETRVIREALAPTLSLLGAGLPQQVQLSAEGIARISLRDLARARGADTPFQVSLGREVIRGVITAQQIRGVLDRMAAEEREQRAWAREDRREEARRRRREEERAQDREAMRQLTGALADGARQIAGAASGSSPAAPEPLGSSASARTRRTGESPGSGSRRGGSYRGPYAQVVHLILERCEGAGIRMGFPIGPNYSEEELRPPTLSDVDASRAKLRDTYVMAAAEKFWAAEAKAITGDDETAARLAVSGMEELRNAYALCGVESFEVNYTSDGPTWRIVTCRELAAIFGHGDGLPTEPRRPSPPPVAAERPAPAPTPTAPGQGRGNAGSGR